MKQLVEGLEEQLFTNVLAYDHHLLSYILPERNNRMYNLRPRRHELILATKGDARNFFTRQLFKDVY